jgi:hypothetical protein
MVSNIQNVDELLHIRTRMLIKSPNALRHDARFRFPSERADIEVALLTRILEVLVSNLDWDIGCRDRFLMVLLSPSRYMPGLGCAHFQILSKSSTLNGLATEIVVKYPQKNKKIKISLSR